MGEEFTLFGKKSQLSLQDNFGVADFYGNNVFWEWSHDTLDVRVVAHQPGRPFITPNY